MWRASHTMQYQSRALAQDELGNQAWYQSYLMQHFTEVRGADVQTLRRIAAAEMSFKVATRVYNTRS